MTDNSRCQGRGRMMCRGAEGGCGTEEKPCPVSRSSPPASSPVPASMTSPEKFEAVILGVDFYSQALKALSERSPFDSDEVLAKTVATLPSGLAGLLSKQSDSKKKHKRPHSETKSSSRKWSTEKSKNSALWTELEDYFRELTLQDIERLHRFSTSFDSLLDSSNSLLKIPALGKGFRSSSNNNDDIKKVENGHVDIPAAATIKEEEEVVLDDNVPMPDAGGLQGKEEDDKDIDKLPDVKIEDGSSDSLNVVEKGPSPVYTLPTCSSIEWVLGSRNRVLLTTTRPTKKRKLLGSNAGLERLIVAQPCQGSSSLCHVCSMGDSGDQLNQLAACKSCKVVVHQKCYGVQGEIDGSWLCSWCKNIVDAQAGPAPGSDRPCVFCPKTGGALKPFQNVGRGNDGSAEFTHLFCSMWMPEVYIDDTRLMEPVLCQGMKDVRGKLVCNLCKLKLGSCVRCSDGSCRTAFHPLCAREAKHKLEVWGRFGCDDIELRAFCSKHSGNFNPDDSVALESHEQNHAVGSDLLGSSIESASLPENKIKKLKIGCKNGDKVTLQIGVADADSNNLGEREWQDQGQDANSNTNLELGSGDGEKLSDMGLGGACEFGGLGKTTLAQLVYNDEDVKNHFDVAAWACVPETGDENIVMRRVYESLTDSDKSDDDRNSSKLTMGHENTVMRLQNGSLTGDKSNNKNSSQLKMGEIKSGIIKLIRNKKYLLILDDIWDEKHKTWTELLDLLKYCARGSKVIVTTRSKKVANALGTKESHTLGLLTKDESRILFKKIAFKTKEDESNSTLTELGEEIVESCGNVPLAIKVIGCLLYDDNSEEHWKGIRDARLSANVKEDKDITQVLKLSYDYLSPALKQCFAYCALFPKDHRYSKERLVKMWMAQGYINPSRIDIGEKYFMGLLGRSLFQDPEEDDEGKVAYCKMHDLVHDLAQDIAGEEIVHDIPQDIAGEEMEQLGESNQVVGDRLLHAGLKMKSKEQDDREVEWEAPESLLDAGLMRSLILHSNIPAAWKIKASSLKMILKFKSLRVLEFSCIRNSTIPNSIGKLRHLRYLDLTNNDIGCLPDGITRLPKEMPPKWLDGLSKLVVIRLTNCRECTDLPHLSQLPHLKHLYLISLSALEYVVEGGKCSSGSHNLYFPSLEVLELHHLDNLKGWARPTTDEPRQLLFPCLLLFQFDVNASSTKAGVIRGDRIQLEGI